MTRPERPAPARRRAEDAGRRGELAAALWLMLRGYRVLAHRVRMNAGEIDLIARRGRVLAFVEVKTRGTLNQARMALQPAQRDALVRAASAWCARRPWTGQLDWRFDLVAVAPWRLPVHLADAWRPDGDPALATRRRPGTGAR